MAIFSYFCIFTGKIKILLEIQIWRFSIWHTVGISKHSYKMTGCEQRFWPKGSGSISHEIPVGIISKQSPMYCIWSYRVPQNAPKSNFPTFARMRLNHKSIVPCIILWFRPLKYRQNIRKPVRPPPVASQYFNRSIVNHPKVHFLSHVDTLKLSKR